ncbi:alpha/beta fold hydrolase [Rubrivivax albus]|uniref:Alpha/beta hydrolase n=1 Tax=Rubrivivax albus TaxID=2499835 RepID=A0A3S2VUU3_9BURK|nr:alpha/beta hydrolase [Rubrivivax albus]RVT49368.1 alpha/beta hydrolase [Rubrivivax albus]
MTIHHVDAGVLRVAFEQHGPLDGPAVVLLHGFPYDVRAFDAVVPPLVAAGCRVVVPWLRGYGATRFLSPATPRSGQQAALAMDLLALLDVLEIPQAVLAGYDWGGRAACIVAALWPGRVAGLVTGGGYNVHHVPSAMTPAAPEDEQRLWYQYYFHSERGRAGLALHRQALCRLLWRLWSPEWRFDDATYDRTAAAFDNPDFVDVVVHSYRVRYGLVAGDPACDMVEQRLCDRPPITVPTITLEGGSDGVMRADGSLRHRPHFTGPYARRVIDGVGHNLPQEAPVDFAEAVLALMAGANQGDAKSTD